METQQNSPSGNTTPLISKSEDDFKPSTVYKRACQHLVYRLSELMFGSLLATYILGFVTAIGKPDHTSISWPNLANIFISLFICVTYVSLTAALYIAYHVCILMRPTLHFPRIQWDFGVAIVQAICFGLSIVFNYLFPFLLGCAICASMLRQWFEFGKFLDALVNMPPRENELKGRAQSRRFMIEKYTQGWLIAKDNDSLRSWMPPRLLSFLFLIFLLIIGAAFIDAFYTHVTLLGAESPVKTWISSLYWVVVLILCVVVTGKSILMLRYHAEFVAGEDCEGIKKLDSTCARLVAAIKNGEFENSAAANVVSDLASERNNGNM